jgi:lysine biosynthesis protein LysW
MAHAVCPQCEAKVEFSTTPKLGQKVTCRSCGEKLEVFELDPIELDYEFGDDDDDDDDDYDDDDDDDYEDDDDD